jgi:hypothetical protein
MGTRSLTYAEMALAAPALLRPDDGMPQSWAEKQDRIARKRRDRVLVWGGGAVVASLVTAILVLLLRRKRPKGGQRSYRQIATELLQAGYANSNGRPFSPSSIKAMLD